MFIYIDYIKMKILIKNFSLLTITLLIASCAIVKENSGRLCADDDGVFHKCEDISSIVGKEKQDNTLFKPGTNFQTINEYTEQMVYILYQKISLQNIEKAIAVPPFISLPSTEGGSQQLNAGIADAFVVDMQNIGLPAAEFLLTNSSEKDQTNFQSYIKELTGSQDFGYVLKGTMRKGALGTMVYARIIDIETKKVIASTSKFLPKYLVRLLK